MAEDKRCFDCNKELTWTGNGPGWMNEEQWEASKAGDFYADCNGGRCYFWDTPGVSTLKRKGER